MDLTNDERAAIAALDDMTITAREAYNAALLACNAAELEYERASVVAALVMVRRALTAEAEVTRLRAENATLRASTDAAVDGVRAMLPAALKVAREEGAAEMRERCAAACNEISKGHNERAKACTKDRDEEWQWGHAGGADECIAAIRALPLDAPAEVKP